VTKQIVYVSATPAEFEIKNSVVGNMGYFLTSERARVGEDEWMPFVVAGESVAPTSSPCTPSFTGRTPVPLSRTDESPNEFDVHTPSTPFVVEGNYSAQGIA